MQPVENVIANFSGKSGESSFKHSVVSWVFIFVNVNPLSANPTKRSSTLKQFVSLSVFDHFVGLALKGLNKIQRISEI